MKVAYFIGSLNRGGTEMLTLDICRKKDYAPYDMVLIYRNDGELTEDFMVTGIPMYKIKPKRLKIGYLWRLRRLIKKENVDVVHALTLPNGFVSVLFTAFTRVKLIVAFHGFFTSAKDRFYTHFVMWFANASVFVSNYVRDWYINETLFAPLERCYVVYDGVDFSKLDKKYPIPDFLENRAQASSETIKLAMVGNFVSGRSQNFLCQALKQFKDNCSCDFQFYFIGKKSESEPYLYDNCVNYCKRNGLWNTTVFFLGGRGDVPAILQNIDAFVYSTNDDTFGIAVVEAIASGLPVVVNDWDVMKEITEDGKHAVLYKTKDVDDLTAKLTDVINNLAHYRNLSLTNAEIVRQRFSIDFHIQNLNKLYNTIL